DEAPKVALGGRVRRERLDETHLAVRKTLSPLLLDAVDGVGGRLAVELDDRGVFRAGASAPLLRVRETKLLPPHPRPRDEARDSRANAVVHTHARFDRVLEREHAHLPARPRVVA